MSPKRALIILIVVSALIRLFAACALGLGNDEAYHFLYAIHPDLSYYDHPPMLAWVETAGLALSGSPFSAVALRSGFILLFAASTWLMWRIAGRCYGPWAGFYAALALNLTGYYGLAASTFALPDGPLLFFWLLTIDRLSIALEEPERSGPWIWVGLAWGGAMLSKYHAIFLPAGTLLFLILHPPMRRWLAKPGPYLAIGLGLLVFSPVLVWNARNGWVSFLFQGGRAVGGFSSPARLPRDRARGAGGLLLPLDLDPPGHASSGARPGTGSSSRAITSGSRVCLAAVPLAVFTAVACFRPVLPHWGLIGLTSLFPVLGLSWHRHLVRRPAPASRWLAIAVVFPIVILGLTILEHHTGCFQRGGNLRWGLIDARTDPTADLYGWDEVALRLEQLGVLDDPNTFLFTRAWYQSAQLAHAIRLKLPVLCYNIDDPRGFAFWSKPGQWVGRDAILLLINDEFTRWRSTSAGSTMRFLLRTSRSTVEASPCGGFRPTGWFINDSPSPSISRPSGRRPGNGSGQGAIPWIRRHGPPGGMIRTKHERGDWRENRGGAAPDSSIVTCNNCRAPVGRDRVIPSGERLRAGHENAWFLGGGCGSSIAILVIGVPGARAWAGPEVGEPPSVQNAAARVDYLRSIKPLLARHCVSCHGAEKPRGGLRLDTAAGGSQRGQGRSGRRPGKGRGEPASRRRAG